MAGTEEDGYACDATLIPQKKLNPSGEYGWLDYVNHHSPEWQEEFTAFCKERDLTINEESAEQFVEWKGDQLENAQED